MDFIGTGVYPLRQAAKLVGAKAASVHRWMRGYSRQGRHYGPLWKSQLADADLGEAVIGFRDLLELRLVAEFAKHGVALSVIKNAADFARKEFRTDYPLTTRRFLTDGKTIFLEAVKSSEESEMLDIQRRQLVFSDIIRASLYKGIVYDGDRATQWYPLGEGREEVVLDPQVQFGAPIVRSAGVPTDVVHAAFLAEGKDRKAVARIYGITPQEVEYAVRFETKLAA